MRRQFSRLTRATSLTALMLAWQLPHAAYAAPETHTPIKHVIVILGENRGFDEIFATYKPVDGQRVDNLLAKGIVNVDGTPGPHYADAVQYEAADQDHYRLNPSKTGPYRVLPPALVGGPATPYVCQAAGAAKTPTCFTEAFLAAAKTFEPDVADDYAQYLLTGGTGQEGGAKNPKPDLRIQYAGHDASHLPSGPYQLTSASLPYDAYTQGPVHRFFQMWQQLDCDAGAATKDNPSGCRADLFPWVEVSVGAGSNGKALPPHFGETSTGEGSTSMSFFNVQQGDAPYLKSLADTYAMSDNYHQAVLGGTGANHIMMGTGDMIWFSDSKGNAAVPPEKQIENPDPQPGTNNFYTQDGYSGGSYMNCADASQPGVAAVRDYLSALTPKIEPRCEAGHYYLVNNYNPGYFGDGSDAFADHNPNNQGPTVPPSNLRTIGDELTEKGISWAYYGENWNRYRLDKYELLFKKHMADYCNICNWAQYTPTVMTNPAARQEHLKDTDDLYAALARGELPAVAYVKPSGLVDGHPESSKLNLFEGFVKKIVDLVKANPTLWDDTAILVTFDEGGGYWDSGYVQPLDFFGDGTRTVMIAVSKYATGGHISHSYADHVSILKFIEANWNLPPVTARSRDNFPNPIVDPSNPYVPTNRPAIGDLMDLFHF